MRFFKLKKVHLLVSELYIYIRMQGATIKKNDKTRFCYFIFI